MQRRSATFNMKLYTLHIDSQVTPPKIFFAFAILIIATSFRLVEVPQDTSKAKRDTTAVARDTTQISPDSVKHAVNDSTAPRMGPGGKMLYRRLPNVAFTAGERLVFDVVFGFVTAGEAVMEIPRIEMHNDRQCYFIQFQVKSLPFFSVFYRVEDRYVTVLDVEGLFPWRFEQHIREGGYSRDFAAEFDHTDGVAKTTEGKYPIPPYVHDIVSAFYFSRTIDYDGFKVGKKIHLQNFYKDSTYSLDVKYRGKQTIEVEAGKFNCVVVEPLVKEGGLFKSEGSILVWLTDDERKMPVKVSSKILVGSISAELKQYSGLNGPIHAKVNE